jgi:hypothetical protein
MNRRHLCASIASAAAAAVLPPSPAMPMTIEEARRIIGDHTDTGPRSLAVYNAWVKMTGSEMNVDLRGYISEAEKAEVVDSAAYHYGIQTRWATDTEVITYASMLQEASMEHPS